MADFVNPIASRLVSHEPTGIRNDVDARLMKAAQKLEASFLSEMLKSAGLGEASEAFGNGGAGEEHFASFLADEYAQAMSARGGIGMAEMIYNSLKTRADHAS